MSKVLHVSPYISEVAKEICEGLPVNPEQLLNGVAQITQELGPRLRTLLAQRDEIQYQIDSFWRAHAGKPVHPGEQIEFLRRIGYIVPEPPAFTIETTNVDPEIAATAAPQLVVPSDNARFVLNAANARWGSLYDALYGSNQIPDTPELKQGKGYNPKRGAVVIEFAMKLLDKTVPLSGGLSHAAVSEYVVKDGRLTVEPGGVSLADPRAFVGCAPGRILFVHNGLHIEVRIDRNHPVGKTHKAGVYDVWLEAAASTIIDFEDSVAVVDAQDKAHVYRNWLRLMKGTLTATFEKDGKPFDRALSKDRSYTAAWAPGQPAGAKLTVAGRSVMLVRNVGHSMFTDAVLVDGQPVPEGFLDCVFSVAAAMHDLRGGAPGIRNSRAGSVYIVKPKMHGPLEVELTCELFARVERLLGLPRNTIKVGIMDEERRTSVNLRACVYAARERVVFINTGFLDRTGDDIHTNMHAGAAPPKGEIRASTWIKSYEDMNVDVGLACGFVGRAQIGKGMWAEPDNLKDMLASKIAHPRAGATTAWVPSPTAATLHALHYHEVDVASVQRTISAHLPRAKLSDLVTPAILPPSRTLTAAEVEKELLNNCQAILGYVVRWVELGVGCSKVPDHRDVGLMEDRATLRINSQHIANWLLHGLVSRDQVIAAMREMAIKVDRQNAADPKYVPMAPTYSTAAFQAALELVFDGLTCPNGLTEGTLTKYRRLVKARKAKL